MNCGRTKSEAIAENVLAMRSLFYVYETVINHSLPLFYSIQANGSNKKILNFSPYAFRFLLKRTANKIL